MPEENVGTILDEFAAKLRDGSAARRFVEGLPRRQSPSQLRANTRALLAILASETASISSTPSAGEG